MSDNELVPCICVENHRNTTCMICGTLRLASAALVVEFRLLGIHWAKPDKFRALKGLLERHELRVSTWLQEEAAKETNHAVYKEDLLNEDRD